MSTTIFNTVVFLQLFCRIPQVTIVLGVPPEVTCVYHKVTVHNVPYNLLQTSLGHRVGFLDSVSRFVHNFNL